LFDWQSVYSVLTVSDASRIRVYGQVVKNVGSPKNQTEFAALQAAVNTYAQSCVDLSTPEGIVAHVGTTDTVQDWNSLQKALGYPKTHFLSLS
jgi:hypothetical protein